MGVTLFDAETNEIVFDVNFWNWRALVEVVRRLDVLPEARVDALHEPWVGELTADEVRVVAAALRDRLLPTVGADERVLLDGERTTTPDDGTFYRTPDEMHKNYSTTRPVIERFAACCASCHGFRVA